MVQGGPFSKILVAFDGSTSAKVALDVAIEMAKSCRASLTAVSVSTVPTALPFGPGGGGFDNMVSEGMREAITCLNRSMKRRSKMTSK